MSVSISLGSRRTKVELAQIEVRRVDESTASEHKVLYKIYLLRKNGEEVRLDEATDAGQMALLAMKVADRCGVRLADRTGGQG